MTRRRGKLAKRRRGGWLDGLGSMLRDKLEGAAERALELGRVVRSVSASADGSKWLLELAPCGHVIERVRLPGQMSIPAIAHVAICKACELELEQPPAPRRVVVEVVDEKGRRS